MSWGKKVVAGVEYDLSHLDPFTMQVTPKGPGAPTYNVRVTFTCHVFSREWRAGDTIEHEVADGRLMRAFCPTRHAHSLGLEAIMRNAATGKVHHNNQTPFVLPVSLPGLAGPYAVYFNAFKAKLPGLDVVVDVRSAHHKPGFPANLPKVTFATIVGNTAAGRPIKRPK